LARIAVFDTTYTSIRTIYYALEGEGHQVVTNVFPEKVYGKLVMKMVTDPLSLVTKILTPRLVDGQVVRPIPDVFIIDFLNLDGEKIASILKQIHSTRSVPVIALSHKGKNIDRQKLLQLYGTHYIPKPFNVWNVVDHVETFLGVTC
jgi:DNA-binding response OmpR family regulator